jgi:6-phosphogluconate dehydrogenase
MRKSFSLTHEAIHNTIKTTIDVKEFGTYKTATAIMLLVPAGKPVDTAIESLLPDKGDILIDGGNTYFTLSAKVHFFGMGIRRKRARWS